MGGNASTMSSKSTTNVTNDFMQSMSTEISNSNSAEALLEQKLNFHANNMRALNGCRISIGQDMTGTVGATLEAVADLTAEQSSAMSTAISNSQKAALSQENSGFPTGTTNESEINLEIETNVSNSLSQSISSSLENMNYSKAEGSQEMNIYMNGLYCDGSSIEIDQNQFMEVVSENIAETVSDSVQAGSAVTEVINKQVAEVKQVNDGLSMSGSGGSSSSSCIVSIAAIGAAVLFSTATSEGGAGPAAARMRGGSEPGGLNIGVGLVIFLIGFVILGLITGIIYKYLPSDPCPTETECSEAWDDFHGGDGGEPDTLRVFHNCRMKHRINGVKPGSAGTPKFNPRCETHCAFVEREEETDGLESNPLKGLFCLDLL